MPRADDREHGLLEGSTALHATEAAAGCAMFDFIGLAIVYIEQLSEFGFCGIHEKIDFNKLKKIYYMTRFPIVLIRLIGRAGHGLVKTLRTPKRASILLVGRTNRKKRRRILNYTVVRIVRSLTCSEICLS